MESRYLYIQTGPECHYQGWYMKYIISGDTSLFPNDIIANLKEITKGIKEEISVIKTYLSVNQLSKYWFNFRRSFWQYSSQRTMLATYVVQCTKSCRQGNWWKYIFKNLHQDHSQLILCSRVWQPDWCLICSSHCAPARWVKIWVKRSFSFLQNQLLYVNDTLFIFIAPRRTVVLQICFVNLYNLPI